MTSRGRMCLFTGVVVSALLFTCGTTRGQTTGSIEGRATDSFGAPLPGVTVEATSPSLQGTRAGVTGRDGAYRFPAVPPGTYSVRASLPGFRTAEKTATVSLDATATVDLTLQPAAAEQVVVSGEAPLVDLTSTTTGTNYTRTVITHLPVSRNYADIVRSNPGVEPDRGETQGRSISLAIYGATSAEHQWIIDGVNTTNVIRGMQGKAINNEFVQEVEVKTGGYQA
ncbi:MAG TPA: carboxypeptidase-like regulatory domain-containing protein, partial [Thermoanaerobaculia bacterium]